MSEPVQVCSLKPNGAHGVIALPALPTIQRFNDLPLLSARLFCHPQEVMRLLAEIFVIAALIFFGWNTPFKEHVAQATTTITNKLHGVGSKLQKHQDPSVRRH